RAVAARVVRREVDRVEHFLRRLDVHGDRCRAVQLAAAGVRVQHVLRLDVVPMMREQPLNAVVPAPAFLARRERQNEVTGWNDSFFLHAEQGGHPTGVAILHVERAAPVEMAVALGERERIEHPVRALRFDHVHVADEQEWRALTASAIPYDEILVLRVFARVGPDHLHISRGKAGGAKSRGQRFREFRRAPDRIFGIGLHHLLQQVPAERLIWRERGLLGEGRGGQERNERDRGERTEPEWMGHGQPYYALGAIVASLRTLFTISWPG